MEAAVDYDERSLIRRQLRELKKRKGEGQPSSNARRGSSAYRRFSGVAVDKKSTTSASKSPTPVKVGMAAMIEWSVQCVLALCRARCCTLTTCVVDAVPSLLGVLLQVFGKLGPHQEITRTPSPSGSESSSQKAPSRASLHAASPTPALADTPPRKASYPQSTGSEGEREELARVNGSSPPPAAEEAQPALSAAVEGRRSDEEVSSELEKKGKEGAQLGGEIEEGVEEVEEERVEASPPEEIEEGEMKDLQREENTEEEAVKESPAGEESEVKLEIVEERVEDLQIEDKVEEEKVKESQPGEKVKEEKVKDLQPEEKVKEEKVKDSQPEEKVKEEKVKDSQPEKFNVAADKEEPDFHFRRRAKTEVKPKSGAAEFQGFKLRKTAAAKETKETKSQPGEKAAEFLGFQLRKTGSTAQKTQGAVETKSQPGAKSSRFQDSREREAVSSVQKAGEMKEKESQPPSKGTGFQRFQERTAESSARKSRDTQQPATKTPEFQGFQLRKTDASTGRSRAQTWGVSAKVSVFVC